MSPTSRTAELDRVQLASDLLNAGDGEWVPRMGTTAMLNHGALTVLLRLPHHGPKRLKGGEDCAKLHPIP